MRTALTSYTTDGTHHPVWYEFMYILAQIYYLCHNKIINDHYDVSLLTVVRWGSSLKTATSDDAVLSGDVRTYRGTAR